MQIGFQQNQEVGRNIKQLIEKNAQEISKLTPNSSKSISKQLENKSIISISKIDLNTGQHENKITLSKPGKSISHSNISDGKNKRKKVVIQEVFSEKQNKYIYQKSKCNANSCKQLQRNPSLKKITKFISSRPQSPQNQIDIRFQESSSSCVKHVKFEQNIQQPHQPNKDNQRTQAEQIIHLNKFYQKIKGCQKRKQNKKESFMDFLCSLFSFKKLFKKRSYNKIQKKIMALDDLKITGTIEQILLLKSIAKFFLIDQLQKQGKQWQKLGFKSQKPVKQLENTGVLMILQWKNFITSNQEQARKLFNFCIQMQISLSKFHQKITQVYCKQIQECKILGSSWQQYQLLYNQLVTNSSYQIFKHCQDKQFQFQKTITEIVENCSKKLKIDKQKIKKTSVKISNK